MYEILTKIIIAAALIELGSSFKSVGDCSSRACLDKLQRASKQVLRIDWKPISVFPEEAKRFKKASH
jgi:hypothetical protein